MVTSTKEILLKISVKGMDKCSGLTVHSTRVTGKEEFKMGKAKSTL